MKPNLMGAVLAAMVGGDIGVPVPRRPEYHPPDDAQTLERIKAQYPHLSDTDAAHQARMMATFHENPPPEKPQRRRKNPNTRNKFGRVIRNGEKS